MLKKAPHIILLTTEFQSISGYLKDSIKKLY